MTSRLTYGVEKVLQCVLELERVVDALVERVETDLELKCVRDRGVERWRSQSGGWGRGIVHDTAVLTLKSRVLPQEFRLLQKVLILEVEFLTERVQGADVLDDVLLLDGSLGSLRIHNGVNHSSRCSSQGTLTLARLPAMWPTRSEKSSNCLSYTPSLAAQV